MKKLRLMYRLLVFFFTTFTLLIFSTLAPLITRNKINRQQKISWLLRWLSFRQIKSIGMKVKITGQEHLQKKENYLIAANHIGYIDIPLLQSLMKNNRFITHDDVRGQNSFLGLIAKAAGSYSIRRDLKNIRTELRDTTNILKNGFHLTFFPEGTSTDGSKIKPFYPFFFSTAIRAGKSILPVYIKYTKVGKKSFNINNRDLICWYRKETNFKQHFVKLLQIKSIEVSVRFLPPISSKGKNPKALAQESWEQMQKYFTPPLPKA